MVILTKLSRFLYPHASTLIEVVCNFTSKKAITKWISLLRTVWYGEFSRSSQEERERDLHYFGERILSLSEIFDCSLSNWIEIVL